MLHHQPTHNAHTAQPINWIAPVSTNSLAASVASGTNLYSDFVLAGILGRELAEPLSQMQSVLLEVERSHLLTGDDVKRLSAGILSARTLAMQSQQIARLAYGRLRQSHEILKLDAMVLVAMQEHATAFRMRGVDVFQRLRPVEVIVDAGLLHSLINAALDWASGLGAKLTVTLEMQNWPEHGLLMFKSSHCSASKAVDSGQGQDKGQADDTPLDDTVSWYLVNEISQAMGLSVKRTSSAQETCLQIEFARTVRRLEGLTAIEVETDQGALNGDSRPMAGARILLITDNARLQMEVRAICKSTRLVLDCVPNAVQAARFCEMEYPALVIIDQHMRDAVFSALYADLRHVDPNFPFIEVAAAANVLEMAGWTSDSMSRLSQGALQTHLAGVVAMELAKVM